MKIWERWDLTNEAERGYVAGIIDGEGCIYIDKFKDKRRVNVNYVLRVRVSMTDFQVPVFLHQKFGGYLTEYDRPPYKRAYIWGITNSFSNDFLRLISPYLLVKKPQVDVALKFISTFSPERRNKLGRFNANSQSILLEREGLKLQMNKLNQRVGKEKING